MILVNNVSKLYRIYDNPAGRLKEILLRGRRKYHRDFWALQDVSLEVNQGETVGIIGRNGAGKTTLLQIIAGVLQPTHGEVTVEGRVTALLELGSGFNPEYTGRENILLSGQILGFSEAEMLQRLDVIVQFAELENFVDQPVKTYSTGMLMRLAFAAAIHVDPDVLIVDEALSVGDVYFQRKSLDRMEYFRKSGKTVLLVSHDPSMIQRFCTRAVWIEGGRVALTGDARKVVTAYQAFCARLEEEHLRNMAANSGIRSQEHEQILRELELTGSRWGNGKIRFTNVEMLNAAGEARWVFRTGEAVTIRLHYKADSDYPQPIFAVDVHRYDGIFVASVNNHDTHPQALPISKGEGFVDLHIARLELPFNAYFLSLKVYTENGAPDWRDPADIHNQMYQFDVITDRVIHGLVQLEAKWSAPDLLPAPARSLSNVAG
ncbi:MAG: ABC transporter ATP-binding protein [Acidobacteria bacterium]|nr:ABC transporter ATP-binding protein [Acidobacteriota bacterium]MBI3423226.1 ABC transporter ATP-binding protein [Acidobacteriota bacterium]